MATPVVLELAAMPEVRCGHYESLFVMVWRGTVTTASLDRTNAVEDTLIKRYGRISVVGVITDLGGGVPSADLRQASADALKRFAPSVRGTTLMVDAGGAKAVLFRTFLAGLTLLIDFESPLKIVKTHPDAATWLQQLPGQDPALLVPGIAEATATFVAQSRPPSR
jgi:hypothetical protein